MNMTTTVEIIDVSLSYNLDGSKNFAIFLTKILSGLQLCHWYSDDYNVHLIIGDLYNDLRKLFDLLQEEIIGIVKEGCGGFVMSVPEVDLGSLLLYKCSPENKIKEIISILNMTSDIFNSQDLKNFIGSSGNGINNTREEILSSCNRAKYLLGLIK